MLLQRERRHLKTAAPILYRTIIVEQMNINPKTELTLLKRLPFHVFCREFVDNILFEVFPFPNTFLSHTILLIHMIPHRRLGLPNNPYQT